MEFYQKSDLACESYVIDDKNNEKNGIISSLDTFFGYDLIKTEIVSERGKEITGKEIGKYLTLYVGKTHKYKESERDKISQALSKAIREILFDFKLSRPTTLVVGLGNRDILADSLGPLVASELVPTHHLNSTQKSDTLPYDLAVLSPGVLAESGISAVSLIKSVTDIIGAELVIVVDACVTSSPLRLLSTVQVSSQGIIPGSARGKTDGEISKSTLGIPVISIGVPTVVSAFNLACATLETSPNELNRLFPTSAGELYTPHGGEAEIKSLSEIIKNAITEAIK